MIRGRLRPLTKNPDNEQYFKYSPSSGFLPSVALGTLLTTNLVRLVKWSFEDLEALGPLRWLRTKFLKVLKVLKVLILYQLITDDSALPKHPISALIEVGWNKRQCLVSPYSSLLTTNSKFIPCLPIQLRGIDSAPLAKCRHLNIVGLATIAQHALAT